MPDKAALRRAVLSRRDAIPPAERAAKDLRIHERLAGLQEFADSGVLFTFVSFRSEVDTFGIMKAAFAAGKSVVVPRVRAADRSLILCGIRAVADLQPGYMGIPEPACHETSALAHDSIDCILVPGAGFDIRGNRIGYGGGYYDRLLPRFAPGIPLVALAYEEQILESVPADAHDVRVGVIVTDSRIIRCG